MNIEGTYTLQAKPEEIRRNLMNQEVLRRSIPGLEQLEQHGEDRYSIAINIKHEPLLGTYQGQIAIQQNKQLDSYRLVIESDGSPNTIGGIGNVQFHESGTNTTITYRGTLTLGKRGTRLNPKVTKGAAKLLIQQFFTTLADQLHIENATFTEEVGIADVIKQPDGDIVILSPAARVEKTESAPIIQRIVRLLQSGAGNSVQEKIWMKRIRRISFVSGFLLLVWVGTRLPRRRG